MRTEISNIEHGAGLDGRSFIVFCSLGFVLFPNSYHVLDKTHCWCRSVCFHCWLDVVLSWYASRSTSLFIQKKYENDKIAFFSDGNYSWCNCKRCLCFVFLLLFIFLESNWLELSWLWFSGLQLIRQTLDLDLVLRSNTDLKAYSMALGKT